MIAPVQLPARRRILVITLRRLGDVLLTTPLVRSLRRAFPDATLDMLVFKGSEGILQGNPDIDTVLTSAERPSFGETVGLIGKLWRRYDLVVSTQTGDRPTFYALLAGSRRIGLVPRPGQRGAWWKQRAYHVAVQDAPDIHRIELLNRVVTALRLEPWPDLVCPQGVETAAVAPAGRYAVLHPTPMYRYKRWNTQGWRDLARALAERGLTVVSTQGPDPAEAAYVDSVWAADETLVIRERGRLNWAGLAALMRGAAVYVGPDTSMTHLAAGCGCPTVALFGATRPRLIAPLPRGGLTEPWADRGTVQRRGNAWVVQNPLPCLPCDKLGCDGHLDSRAQCLDELTARQVLVAVDQALAGGATAKRPL